MQQIHTIKSLTYHNINQFKSMQAKIQYQQYESVDIQLFITIAYLTIQSTTFSSILRSTSISNTSPH